MKPLLIKAFFFNLHCLVFIKMKPNFILVDFKTGLTSLFGLIYPDF